MNKQPMFKTCEPLILASASPRRRQLLAQFGLDFVSVAARVNEIPEPGEGPENFTRRMAENKAEAVARRHPCAWIVGADTVITLNRKNILGKPSSPADALSILQQLSGQTHQVLTGLCLCRPDKKILISMVESTQVTFIKAPDELLLAYIATGEPMDKAGAYGIQGLGSFLVREINGSCSNVIGLPMGSLIPLLVEYRIITPILSD